MDDYHQELTSRGEIQCIEPGMYMVRDARFTDASGQPISYRTLVTYLQQNGNSHIACRLDDYDSGDNTPPKYYCTRLVLKYTANSVQHAIPICNCRSRAMQLLQIISYDTTALASRAGNNITLFRDCLVLALVHYLVCSF